MPQMSPLLWELLNLMTLSLVFLLLFKLFFFKESSYYKGSLEHNMSSSTKGSNNIEWSW